MDQDQKNFIAGMEQMLRGHGFEDVHMELVPIPQHITKSLVDALKEEGEEEIEEGLALDFEYYRVTTKQGVFGMMMGVYPMLDLSGTGISLSEFLPEEDAADIPPNFPPIIGFGDSEQLLLLWQLLTKKKAQP